MESLRSIRERNLVEVSGVTSVGDALMLQKISHRLHQLDEAACNWGLSERQEKRETRLEAQAQEIASRYNLTAFHQSDPRGWSLYLIKPEQLEGYASGAVYDQGVAICPH